MANELQKKIEEQLGVKISHLVITVVFQKERGGVPEENALDNLPDQIVIDGETFNFGMGTFNGGDSHDPYSEEYAEWMYDNYSEGE
jgi:hypothetical protein